MGTNTINKSEIGEPFAEKNVLFDSTSADQPTSNQDLENESRSEPEIYLLISRGGRKHDPHGGQRIRLFGPFGPRGPKGFELREKMCTVVLLILENLGMGHISCIILEENLLTNAVMALNFIANQDTMENLVVVLMVLTPVNMEMDPEVVPVADLKLKKTLVILLGNTDIGPEVVLAMDVKQFHRRKPGNRERNPREDFQSRRNGGRLEVDSKGNWDIIPTIPNIINMNLVSVMVVDLNIVVTDPNRITNRVQVLDVFMLVVDLNIVCTNPNQSSDKTIQAKVSMMAADLNMAGTDLICNT
ncbi:14937_t:CDS:2 [Acaulospora colombiana]|uniref:14937_t:CDS:1 n=1 Tax=Acaulospora colombiana TaxID=27376 RepID=A0ACA9MGH9_9GLOM|nr:14937_t:CDS:2 [Acaulospora colombiana]